MKRPLFILAFLIPLMVSVACDSKPQVLRLAAPSASLDLEIAENLEQLLAKTAGIHISVSDEQYAGEDALDMLLAGDADLALVSNFLPYRVGITTIMPLYPSVLHIAYKDGRDASDGLALLTDARIYAGAQGSASHLMMERILARLNVPEGSYQYVDQGERFDVAVVFAPISPQRKEFFSGSSLFSFGTAADIGTGSVIDGAALLNPPLRPFVIPVSTYGAATPQPVLTVAVDKLLVARSDLDPSIAYDLINEVLRLRPALSAQRPGLFGALSDQFDVSRSTFVVHSGTQDFLQRSEPTVYERYSGVAEVVVTLMIALASATLAGFRILKMRRKNRIDRFYSTAIEIRDSLSELSSEKDKNSAAAKIRALQNTAFDQLVAEKLSADESFQIFITLSNDVLRQLEQPVER